MLPTPATANTFSCQTSKCPLDPSDGSSKPRYTYFMRTSSCSRDNIAMSSSICAARMAMSTRSVTLNAWSFSCWFFDVNGALGNKSELTWRLISCNYLFSTVCSASANLPWDRKAEISFSSGPAGGDAASVASSSRKLSSQYWSTSIFRKAELDVFFDIFIQLLSTVLTTPCFCCENTA